MIHTAAIEGERFGGGLQSISSGGIAPVQAIPSVSPSLVLYNGELDSGVTYIVRRVHKWLISGTAAAGSTLMYALSNGKVVSPPNTMATNYTIQRLGKSGPTSNALISTGVSFSPAVSTWLPLTSDFQVAASNLGEGDAPADVDGLIVIPPGYALGVGIVSGSGTSPLYGFSFVWDENG